MPDGDTLHRAASAMRTALAGARVTRFEAARLIGPVPSSGRIVERIGQRGRHLELAFDDGLVLHTQLKYSGAWHLYRPNEGWRRPHRSMSAVVEVDEWRAVCFDASLVETFRVDGRGSHPAMGRLGPDITRHDADLRQAVDLLLSSPHRDVPVAEALVDQRVMRGVGTVYRSEILWANQLSPFAPVRALSQHDAIRLVNSSAHVLRLHLDPAFDAGEPNTLAAPKEMAVHARNGQRCRRCGETIERCRLGVRQQELYWCPGCQTHLDPRATGRSERRAMDPHPAAQKFLADLPWNRDVG